jgi:RNA polymerase sigma factor (sigma-70 family)
VNDLTDQQLLRDYTEQQSEAAFGELARRYVDLVYSAAVRMICDADAAKDVTQAVFVLLAQEAPQLTDRPALAGWLHCTARNLAVKSVRSDVRRRAREQEAAVMNELLSADSEADWKHIAPQLDAALSELSEPDREALLLRYFKNHDLRTVGATLGISDDAAQKRVSRAVERLREFFAKRGVTVGASGLAVVISANAVQAAPVGLALTISTAAVLTGTTLTTTATVTATKIIAMTTLQKTIVTATIAVLAGMGIYEARKVSLLNDQVESLQQQTPLLEHVQKLQSERDEATKQLAGLADELASTKKGNLDLLRLRSEVGLLRQHTNRLGELAQALSTTLASVNSPGAPLEQTNFPRESWTLAGRATPENTLQSFMWAKNRGDVATALSTATPELWQQQKELYFQGKSDEEISAMLMNSAKKQMGFQILKKMEAADDQVVFQVHIDGMSEKSYALLTMKKFADEWKVSSVEERSDKPFAPSK